MTTTLIVLAHPSRQSFNGAWAEASAAACAAAGHKVLWSDLSAHQFEAVEGARHFGQDAAGPFDPLKAHEAAVAAGTVPMDMAAEAEKIRQADQIIFHFPLWWFAPPAVLKGWFDRALVHGDLHTVEERFDTGRCRGKRALFCVTTGASAAECGPGGKEGDVSLLLWPSAYTLRYLGFDVYVPEVVHGVHGYFEGAEEAALQARLTDVLDKQAGLVAGLAERPLMRFNADSDFDESGRLKAGAESFSAFI
ncbi:MAG: NAD(P)H-dependent oxidoreductase [Shimia sp.]|uniref:NAD(P)H-dependent oxidoreductase n=1 Tax=Shimia sp. TaxID=1954381 RepID=UPI001B228BB6|nr:NAD(P)H-dependent oxidoreductase [Shimia sp.]MBO6899526.1 NAD(P)H-dependent oxidoreductase [Shimia sp.]